MSIRATRRRALSRAAAAVSAIGWPLLGCASRTDRDALAAKLDRQLEDNAARHGIAGQAVLVQHNGDELYRRTQGFADVASGRRLAPDQVYPLYSVSKLFASTLVMQLVERRQLDLDQPASRYVALPPRWGAIKVAEFLNHVSGVPEYFDAQRLGETPFPATKRDVFAALAQRPLIFETATDVAYTQTNFLVVTSILEAHHGRPYRDIVTAHIIERLRLRDTTLGLRSTPAQRLPQSYRGREGRLEKDPPIDWPDYAIAHAELYATLDDVGRFMKAVCNGELLERRTLAALWQPYRLKDGRASWFAAGWELVAGDRRYEVGHDGGTKVRVRLAFDAAMREVFGFAYLTNGSATNVWSRTLVDSVAAIAR
jgi:CubicO group peptidase (beta-lactamase class C family)